MPTHDANDVVETRRICNMLWHLLLPPKLVSIEAVLESLLERRRIDSLRFRLAFEERANLCEIHSYILHEPEDVVDVTALDALDDAAQLLRGDLLDWIDVECDCVR